jgi:hypothetical protein
MTSDGITTEDWNEVHELAVEIVNHSAAEDHMAEARARASLMALLDRLDQKYGKRPSLLATRADYVESPTERERLLLSAFSEAERIKDSGNRMLVAESLASLYLEELRNLDEGARWLGVWRDELGEDPARRDRDEVSRFERILLGGGDK